MSDYRITHYVCLNVQCGATYLARMVEDLGKTVCTWDGADLAPKEEPANARIKD